MAITMFGASNRLRPPLPATETSRLEPTWVNRRYCVPISISIPPSAYIFDHAYIGEESGSHDVPEPSRDPESPRSMVDLMLIPWPECADSSAAAAAALVSPCP